ncbi:hypothetical protein H4R20_005069 [Coemansia guatemalensis]|uniref:Fungal-type protein kinase domain-containing protein n=1 Tax=Coemansia guatemalensis TaxID=2761395 RepID=A0A9W8LS75_9FUNG|nr:hypothetical protein H4R20_005069 [Coemansia guatemalensis]
MSPAKKTSGQIGSITGRGVSSEQMKTSRAEEAESDYNTYFREGIANVIDMADPCDRRYQATAAQVAIDIARDLEARITVSGTPDSCSSSSSSETIPIARADISESMPGKTKLADNKDLANVRSLCTDKGFRNEAALSKLFASFIRCVARRVTAPLEKSAIKPDDYVSPRRLVFPVVQMDFKCRDASADERIDIGIACASPDKAVEDLCPTDTLDAGYQAAFRDKPGYVDLLMIVEAKHLPSSTMKAHMQLFRYTRMLYQTQHDRQLAWGMVICGTHVQVCLFTPTDVLASESLVLTTPGGRAQLVKLFVNLSFCERHQLGYDPTIVYLPELQCWRIQVPENDDNDSEKDFNPRFRMYYSNTMVVTAGRLCGRHTRCFLAVSDPPSADNPIECMDHKVIVKDAWPESNVDVVEDARDEIRFLRKIRRKLAGSSEVAGKYPIIKAGGRVYIQQSEGSKWKLDMVRGHPPSPRQGAPPDVVCPVRVHKRVVISPVGQPLNKLNSVYELVIVIADAMRCHAEIVSKCGVLHRDISWNNILFRREAESVQGMLIDFDCALDLANPGTCLQTEFTGTGPFMSIINLECSTVPQSALNDWELVVHLLCWYGVFGLNGRTEPANLNSRRRIHGWVEGEAMQMADAKRNDLDSRKNFGRITRDFCPKINPVFKKGCLLTDLVHTL